MDDKTWDRIVKYTELQGTSGQEFMVRKAFREDLAALVDEIYQNGLGGIYGVRQHSESSAPRIMFGAHFDEVGFIVKSITEQGLFEVKAVGGWNPYVVSAQRFTLFTRHSHLTVVSSSVAPHLLREQSGVNGAPTIDQILFDGGFTSSDEAISFGIQPGDFIVPQSHTEKLANQKTVVSKSWDNRFGLVTILDVLEKLKGQSLPNTLIMGANVQEEVGLRGVGPAVHQLQPDIFFGLDSSTADDIHGQHGQGHLGGGTILRVFDPGVIMPKKLKEFILDLANDEHIPLQYFVPNGGTDSAGAQSQNNGIPSVTLGVASRYIHTHQTIWSIDDFEAAKQLVETLALKLDSATIKDIIYGD
ncbi:glutamyl aminopeptidase [Weissella diestrammenae]|uniref:Glutamyl aminopeptidase n=1 Tax=Weissella diestrammenae TaxID=1162633 RepID=A0A7G9T5K8_9LACO|nr:glutamyl aminopeptidase [Weissella diestrammenae]MCM0582210.1 glutamyl aminopeptidase [Weissella diestrammenae]QNN75383.1 glutamyl aminopeptidase [Weissella diestrammenae]